MEGADAPAVPVPEPSANAAVTLAIPLLRSRAKEKNARQAPMTRRAQAVAPAPVVEKKKLQEREPETDGESVPRNGFGLELSLTVAEGCSLDAAGGRCVRLADLHSSWREDEEVEDVDEAEAGDFGEDDLGGQSMRGAKKRRRQRPEAAGWATAGVVVSVAENSFSLASSWHGAQVTLVREGEATTVKLPLFACLVITKPAVSRDRGRVTLTVTRAAQVAVVGMSKSIALCVQVKKKGDRPCGRLYNARRSLRCAMHEEELYHKTQSGRMELNTALAYMPKKFKEANAPRRGVGGAKKTVPLVTMEEMAQKALEGKVGGGLGARSLAALVGKEGPRLGPPTVTPAVLREAKAVAGNQGSFLHPNSWQLYQSSAATVPKQASAPKEVELVCLELSDE